jgi:hypothetical protein
MIDEFRSPRCIRMKPTRIGRERCHTDAITYLRRASQDPWLPYCQACAFDLLARVPDLQVRPIAGQREAV